MKESESFAARRSENASKNRLQAVVPCEYFSVGDMNHATKLMPMCDDCFVCLQMISTEWCWSAGQKITSTPATLM